MRGGETHLLVRLTAAKLGGEMMMETKVIFISHSKFYFSLGPSVGDGYTKEGRKVTGCGFIFCFKVILGLRFIVGSYM